MLFSVTLILLAFVVILALPVDIVFNIQRDETNRNDVIFVLLGGLIRLPLTSRFGDKWQNKAAKKTRNRGQSNAASLMWNADFRNRLFKYIRRLVRSIKIKTLSVNARLGLDDPADTGRLWGFVGPLTSLLAGIRKANIRIEPEFAEEIFALRSNGRISVIPLRLLSISLLFFLSPRVIRALAFKS